MDCVILCGGLGTRLCKTVPNLPKALAPINGFPFLEILFKQLESFEQISRIILATGYRAEQIEKYFQENPPLIKTLYSHETTPLGTGGCLCKALELCESEDVLVINGDCYSDYSLSDFHVQHRDTNASITMLCPYVKDSSRYGQIEIDSEALKILSFNEKGPIAGPGRINGGVYILKQGIFLNQNYSLPFSLEKSVFPQYIRNGLYAHLHDGVFIDIGTHHSFVDAQEILKHLTLVVKK